MSKVDNPQAIRKQIIWINLELNSSISPSPERKLELQQNLHRLEERFEELTESTTSPDESPMKLRTQDLVRHE